VRLALAFQWARLAIALIRKLDAENVKTTKILIYLTETSQSWGFGLFFLHLRNKKHWDHKRVYRIYCDLELNLRIKPNKRLELEAPAPAPLAVPEAKNET